MKSSKLNFIVTTMNGYIIERIPLADYEHESANDIINKLFEQTFNSKHIGEFNYVNDVAGNVDDMESFITDKNNLKCDKDNNPEFSIKKTIILKRFTLILDITLISMLDLKSNKYYLK